jgi:hypothetical protein
MGKELTIKISFQERIKIHSDPLLEGKQDSSNEIQDFKRRNVKNQERIMTIQQRNNGPFLTHSTNFCFMSK